MFQGETHSHVDKRTWIRIRFTNVLTAMCTWLCIDMLSHKRAQISEVNKRAPVQSMDISINDPLAT